MYNNEGSHTYEYNYKAKPAAILIIIDTLIFSDGRLLMKCRNIST